MSLKMWLVLILVFVNYPLQIRAKDEKNTCTASDKWTVFQRRKYGNVDFFRGWDDYKKGFGDCDGDFWLGLEELHQLTKSDDMSLEINMMSKDKKEHLVARYKDFRIGPGSDNYTLYVSGFSGDATYDALAWGNNRQFSTKDADHDGMSELNCASLLEGGWWYGERCALTNMNGNFNSTDSNGIYWGWDEYQDISYTVSYRLLRFSQMKIYKRCAAHEKWTVFQRRKYGNVDFFRGWDDYVYGFGDCDGDFWLGLEELHQVTKGGGMSLKISMMSKDEKKIYWARYSNFSIGHGSENYTLHVSTYSGNATYNALAYHNNRQFTTKDEDHDDRPSDNCASLLEGGWWYGNCSDSNLNGNFNKTDANGLWWRGDGPDQDLRSPNLLGYSEMKFYKHKIYATQEKWTVFQRRKYGNVSFYRGWDDYVNGFGDCDGDFWLGLEALHQLTNGDDMSLEINMMSKGKKDHLVAKYRYFRIAPSSDKYRLYVSGYSGNAGDVLYNNGQFSTKDADHDGSYWRNCAHFCGGGWWYYHCAGSFLTGKCAVCHLNGSFNRTGRIGIWQQWDVDGYLCCSEMKVYNRT